MQTQIISLNIIRMKEKCEEMIIEINTFHSISEHQLKNLPAEFEIHLKLQLQKTNTLKIQKVKHVNKTMKAESPLNLRYLTALSHLQNVELS